jgi:carotenoid cleavage dioxygenase-like enzyme
MEQPLHYDMMALMESGTLDKGMRTVPSENTTFYVAPLKANAESVAFDAPRFFFGHQVNAFSRGDGKYAIDVNMQNSIFFDRYSLNVQRDKALRDEWPTTALADGTRPGYMTVVRYELDVKAKTVTQSPLFGHESADNIWNEHDLFKIHPADVGKPYCGYWAWQSYYNSTSFASWAVVRAELCGDAPKVAAVWHRANVYPGEATFVPKPNSPDKTEGVLLFKALDGNTGKSIFVVCDAKTLDTLAEAELPVHVPFTVHGEWFPSN